MDTRSFHYSKASGIILFIVYIGMSSGFTYGAVLPGNNLFGHIFLALMACGSWIATWFILTKWVQPALRGDAVFTVGENGIDLRNKFTPIPWEMIDSVSNKYGRYGSTIGIKLKDIDSFMAMQPAVHKSWRYRWRCKTYGYHFGIACPLLAAGCDEACSAITEMFVQCRDGG